MMKQVINKEGCANLFSIGNIEIFSILYENISLSVD